jgi:transcriptional regulator with PAS, ATPase and Fis domain
LLPEYRLQSKDQSTKPTADRVQTTDELRSEAYEEAEAEELTASDADSLNIRQVELEQIRKALAKNKGNRKKAAEELGISDRTLYRRLKDL